MTNLEEQLLRLQLQKQKVELFKLIKEAVLKLSGSTKGASEQETKAVDEVFSEVRNFIDLKIAGIENGVVPATSSSPPLLVEEPAPVPQPTPPAELSQNEIAVLRELALRAAERMTAAPNDPMARQAQPAPPTQAPRQQLRPQGGKDVLAFSLQHRHLSDKRVIAHTQVGPQSGVVTGIDMPNIVVRLDTGAFVKVPPEAVALQG